MTGTISNALSSSDRESMMYLVDLGREISTKGQEPKEITIHGEKYIVTGSKLERFQPKQPKFSDIFSAYSLQGLVDFLRADVDKYFDHGEACNPPKDNGPTSFPRFIVRVACPTRVEVLTPVFGPDRIRSCIAFCEVDLPRITFDRYIPAEDMLIMLNTRFMPHENLPIIMQLVGNIRNEQSTQTADDGFSQRVTVKAGVAEVQDVKVENPAFLIPKRTYHEVQQPGSPFVLRFKDDGTAALFETDGGAWQYEAVKNISAWLHAQLKESIPIVPVDIIA